MIRLFIVFASLCLILSPLNGLAKSGGKKGGGKEHRTVTNKGASPSDSAYEHASDNASFKRGESGEDGAGGKGKWKGKKKQKGEDEDGDHDYGTTDEDSDSNQDLDQDQSGLNEDSDDGGKVYTKEKARQKDKRKQKGEKQE